MAKKDSDDVSSLKEALEAANERIIGMQAVVDAAADVLKANGCTNGDDIYMNLCMAFGFMSAKPKKSKRK
jgi:hypothetical protein